MIIRLKIKIMMKKYIINFKKQINLRILKENIMRIMKIFIIKNKKGLMKKIVRKIKFWKMILKMIIIINLKRNHNFNKLVNLKI